MPLSDIASLIWSGLFLGAIGMTVTKTVFWVFGGRSSTLNKEPIKSYIPWIAEYLAFATCCAYFLYLAEIY